MAHPGSFKLWRHARAPRPRGERLVASLQRDIRDAANTVRARRVFREPREIFRLEIANRERCYRRTTLLDRPTLDALHEGAGVRTRLRVQSD